MKGWVHYYTLELVLSLRRWCIDSVCALRGAVRCVTLILHRVQPPPQFDSPCFLGVVEVVFGDDEVEGHVEVPIQLLVGHHGSCRAMDGDGTHGEREKVRVGSLK